MSGSGKNVISAKISDGMLSSMDETMAYLNIETRQELIKRAITLYISTFKVACEKNGICIPSMGTPDNKTLFTVDKGEKSIRDDIQHDTQSKSFKSGECYECGRFSMKLEYLKSKYVSKWLCSDCIKKYCPNRES